MKMFNSSPKTLVKVLIRQPLHLLFRQSSQTPVPGSPEPQKLCLFPFLLWLLLSWLLVSNGALKF